jgi:hypothetical protein
MPVRLLLAFAMPVRLLLAIVMPVRLLLVIVLPVRLLLPVLHTYFSPIHIFLPGKNEYILSFPPGKMSIY